MSPNSTSDSDAGEMAGVSILLVEDESITREFLSQIIPMKVPSVNIHTAENGQVGLELFRKLKTDLVLTDISMPVMDGIQMARRIKNLKPEVGIIALSGHSSLEGQADNLDTLFVDYISKPIIIGQLCAVICECIKRVALGRKK